MKVFASILLSIATLASSCNLFMNCEESKGPITTKILELENVHSLELKEGIKLNLSQGSEQLITLVAPENYINLLNIEVKNGEWEIDFKKCLKNNEEVELFVQLKQLNEIEINGSGSVIGSGIIAGDHLEIDITGSGDVQLEVENKSMDLEISGSGNIQLSGITKKQKIEINGSGDVKNTKVISDQTVIEINGSGDVRLTATHRLEVEVNGSGDVYYQGTPKQIKTEFNGSGRLHQLD